MEGRESGDPQEAKEEMAQYRTKVIEFLGRTTPIILQNDNGPCPLLAICNVLSLKNSLNLQGPDIVSQEKLLSLVAERLIDSNTNLIHNKDSGYLENQQQNIADAIDLLPRLTTGIDVNLKFTRIDDFEFTRECAIFDLLDIPLYHGWIVDPQDLETADAIGSKSYNTLMGELVSLETRIMENEKKKNTEDDTVDFVAATTAALGVPSPCLSRGQSFEESPRATRKGDIEEESELQRIMKLSEANKPSSLTESLVADVNVHDSANIKKPELVALSETVEKNVSDEIVKNGELISDERNTLGYQHVGKKFPEVDSQETFCLFPEPHQESSFVLPNYEKSTILCENVVERAGSDSQVQSLSIGQEPPSASNGLPDKSLSDQCANNDFTSKPHEPSNLQESCKETDSSSLLTSAVDSDSLSGRNKKTHESEALTSQVEGSEPIYEGEECILEPGTAVVQENREPVYEGEVVLAEQVDGGCEHNGSKYTISIKQGELIRNFMKNSASQLTIYGLFCLQDKVKERELCVFFRNNHFNTMFKYEGDLYILATDQGFINQQDLVWEKLNEVNGDTLYMTGNFKEFKMDDTPNNSWDEQNAMASTADYISSIEGAAQTHPSFNSDLQLAIALQQQEFEQQQQQPQNSLRQPSAGGTSRLVTGPQVSLSSGKHTTSSSKPESKSKDKCIVM